MFADRKASGPIVLLLSLYFGSVNNFVTNTLKLPTFKRRFLRFTQHTVSDYFLFLPRFYDRP